MDNQIAPSSKKKSTPFVICLILLIISLLALIFSSIIYVSIIKLMTSDNNDVVAPFGLIVLLPLYFMTFGLSAITSISSFGVSLYNVIKFKEKSEANHERD